MVFAVKAAIDLPQTASPVYEVAGPTVIVQPGEQSYLLVNMLITALNVPSEGFPPLLNFRVYEDQWGRGEKKPKTLCVFPDCLLMLLVLESL